MFLLWAVAAASWCLAMGAPKTPPGEDAGALKSKLGLEFLRQQASNRFKRSIEQEITDCTWLISDEGTYFHAATYVNETCGIFIFAKPEEKIEIRVSFMDVPCETGGLISLLDGWELKGDLFPSVYDHPNPNARALEDCGRKKVKDVFRTSQNAGMILYRMPRRSSGFRFSVRFTKNPRPCNVLLQDTEATMTIRNYGAKSNCTILSLFSAEIKVLSLSVGVVSTVGRGVELETGTIHKVRLQCNKRGLDDYVQIGGSRSFDTTQLHLVDAVCGMNSIPGKRADVINCGVTVVRLVSSGAFDNSATISMRKLGVEEEEEAAFGCLQGTDDKAEM